MAVLHSCKVKYYDAKIEISILIWLFLFGCYEYGIIRGSSQDITFDVLLWSGGTAESSSLLHESSKSSNHSKTFYSWNDACIYSSNPKEWIIEATCDASGITSSTREGNTCDVLNVKVFQGQEFETHAIKVIRRKESRVSKWTTRSRYVRGTYLLSSHHTPNNNFHVHNDFLLPVYRIFRQTGLNGLILFQGCISCWENRLDIANHIIQGGLKLKVFYPLEKLTTDSSRVCVDRLIISKHKEAPFYKRKGQYSTSWPSELFSSYRELVHSYFKYGRLQETKVTAHIEDNSTKRSSLMSTYRMRPLMSWISRGTGDSCHSRCIKNELDIVREFSRYFRVKRLFSHKNDSEDFVMTSIMETNVLIGLHGAGLGYTSLLPNNAIVVELKTKYGMEKKLFLNMASSLNISYYAVTLGDIGLVESSDVYLLPMKLIKDLAKDVYDAYQLERKSQDGNMKHITGNCNFPPQVLPLGYLSSNHQSRCYLQEFYHDGEWWQCSSYWFC
jgi:hypothetical protein